MQRALLRCSTLCLPRQVIGVSLREALQTDAFGALQARLCACACVCVCLWVCVRGSVRGCMCVCVCV